MPVNNNSALIKALKKKNYSKMEEEMCSINSALFALKKMKNKQSNDTLKHVG